VLAVSISYWIIFTVLGTCNICMLDVVLALFLSACRYSFIHSSVALQPFVGPWPLLQFCNLFTQTVGLLGRVIRPLQGLYLNTGQHKHRINAHIDIHASCGIRTHDPSVRAREDSSCLRQRGHCDRLKSP
jgi:hypothetical protein